MQKAPEETSSRALKRYSLFEIEHISCSIIVIPSCTRKCLSIFSANHNRLGSKLYEYAIALWIELGVRTAVDSH